MIKNFLALLALFIALPLLGAVSGMARGAPTVAAAAPADYSIEFGRSNFIETCVSADSDSTVLQTEAVGLQAKDHDQLVFDLQTAIENHSRTNQALAADINRQKQLIADLREKIKLGYEQRADLNKRRDKPDPDFFELVRFQTRSRASPV